MPAGLITLLLFCLIAAVFWGWLFVVIMRVIEHERVLLGRPLSLSLRIGSLAPSFIATITAMAVILVTLFWRRETTVRVAIALLWLGFILMPAISLSRRIFSGSLRLTSAPDIWLEAVQIVFALIATAYLLRSRRVVSFYAPHADLGRVFD